MMRIYLIIYSMFFAVSTIAADLSVMPVGLKLTTGHDRDAITITNQGQETVVMQLETVSWEQVDGRDIYQPTQNLLVNPPLFTMAPGQTQILRVGLRQPLNNEQEIAYRLFLREVPSQVTASEDNNANGNIRVLLLLRLPVYVVP
jgi:fimbrial chaperone protein